MSKSTLLVIVKDIPRFKCKQCGYCCKIFDVPISFTEASTLQSQIHKKLTIDSRISELPDQYTLLPRLSNGNCAFLSPNTQCGIYQLRPNACRLFPYRMQINDQNDIQILVYKSAEVFCQGLLLTDRMNFTTSIPFEVQDIGIKEMELQNHILAIIKEHKFFLQ